MRSSPLASALLRTILAVVFGFMSLFHGTVMSFAKSNLAEPASIAASHGVQPADHGAHRHGAGHAQDMPHEKPGMAPSCYGVGCFLALNSFAVMPPSAGTKLVSILAPAIDRMMVPAALDPAVPPPRIQI